MTGRGLLDIFLLRGLFVAFQDNIGAFCLFHYSQSYDKFSCCTEFLFIRVLAMDLLSYEEVRNKNHKKRHLFGKVMEP